MNKAVVWALGVVVGLPVLALATGVILVNTIDQQAMLNRVSKVVKEDMGRDLQFNGPVKLKWFPSIGVELSGVSLSEYQSEQGFLDADKVNVSLALLPLFSSNIVVDEVQADGVSVRVVKNKQGQFNFDDLTGVKATSPESVEPDPEQSGQVVNFSVEAIALTNLNVQFEDQQQGLNASLENFNFTSGRIEPGIPTDLGLSGKVKANKPDADLQINLKSGLQFGLGDDLYAKLSNLSLTVDGQLDKQNANIEVSARQLDFNPNTMAVELAELTAKVKAALPGLGQLDASMSAPALQLTEKTAVGESFVVDLALVQPEGRKVNSQLTLRKLAGNLQQNVTGQLAVNLDLDESARKLKFNLSSPLSVNVSEQLVALSGFTGGLDVTDSSLPNGKASMPLTGSLSAGIKKQQVDLELSSTYEATQFNLKAGVNDFTNPFITAAFEADKLDVDALLPPAKEGGKGQKGEGQSTPIDDVPIDLSPLKAMNADATVKVGYLKASGIVVNNLSLRAVSKAGRLTVSPMTANLYEGNSKGSVVADANTNLVTIKQSLSGVQIEPLLKDVLSKDMAAGKGNVEIDLTTKGKTVGAMKAALNGRVAVALTDGAVKGFNLAESLRGAKNLFSGTSSNDTSQADTTKQTDFSSMSVSFNVKDGVATSNDLNLMAPLFRIGGAGTIDLVKNSLDYTANAAIVATSTGQGGKTLDSGLKGLNVPVRLYGSFASVKWEVLLQELAKAALKSKVGSQLEEKKEALKTQVDEQKQEIKNQAQEKLKDSLKGFFGR